MPDIYINLSYDAYKHLEDQCRAFEETTHGEGTDYYHKAIALVIDGVRFEFHGPNVKARVMGDGDDDARFFVARQCLDPNKHEEHEWDGSYRRHWCAGAEVPVEAPS